MKRLFLVLGIILLLLLVFVFTAPSLFKSEIEELVLTQANNSISADLHFEELKLSFIKDFPNATVSLNGLVIDGVGEFEETRLADIKNLDVIASLPSIIMGDQIVIKRVEIDKGDIYLKVLENGKANWDIALPSTDTTASEAGSGSGGYKIGLNKYLLRDSKITYEDMSMPMLMILPKLEHEGSGNFTDVDYVLKTVSEASGLVFEYSGIRYLDSVAFSANAAMDIHMGEAMGISFLENRFRINDLGLEMDGDMDLYDSTMQFDLKLGLENNSNLKKLYSLIPGVFTEGYEDIQASGEIDFLGALKGEYSENSFPAFNVNLNVSEGKIQYPDLPKAISNLFLNMKVSNPGGTLDKTEIHLGELKVDIGDSPIRAKATINGLDRIYVDGEADATLDLEELSTILPMEGNELKGIFDLHANAKGMYDEKAQQFPIVDAVMELKDGFVKNPEYPEAEITSLNFRADVKDVDQSMQNASLNIPAFSFLLDDQAIKGKASVNNFDDPKFNIQGNGRIDLDKMLKIYPVEGMELSGIIDIHDFQTKGQMSDVEAENYTAIASSGDVSINGLDYRSSDYPQGIKVENAKLNFTPEHLEIANANGYLGESDFRVQGNLENYLAYALLPNQDLKGALLFSSTSFNANEWMVENEGNQSNTPDNDSDSVSMEVFPVPAGLDIILQTDIGLLKYGKLDIRDVEGLVSVADQQLTMEGLTLNTLGGKIGLSGNYDTRELNKPLFGFRLDIAELAFSKAYESFSAIRAFVPVAKFIDGKFNGSLNLGGVLNKEMMPELESLTSEGLFEVLEGSFGKLPPLEKLASATQINDLKGLSLKDLKGNFSIKDGYLEVDPFEIKHNDMIIYVSGRQNITGDMDYQLVLDLPAGSVGASAYSALGKLTGGAISPSERVNIDLGLSGPFSDPEINGLGSTLITNATEEAKDLIKGKLKDKVGEIFTNREDSSSFTPSDPLTNTNLPDSSSAVLDPAKDSLKKKIDKEIEKKIGEENIDKLNKLKDKLKLPFPKKKSGND